MILSAPPLFSNSSNRLSDAVDRVLTLSKVSGKSENRIAVSVAISPAGQTRIQTKKYLFSTPANILFVWRADASCSPLVMKGRTIDFPPLSR